MLSKLEKNTGLRFLLGLTLASGAVALAGYLWPALLPGGARHYFNGLALGFGACWLAFKLMPRWWREAVHAEHESKAGKRYMREMIPAMVAYVVLLPVSIVLIKRGLDPLPVRAAVALLPVLPIVFVLRAFYRYVTAADEFQRKIELESISVAALIVSILYMSAGFLQLAKVIRFDAGAAMIWVFPVMALGYAIGKFLAVWRYR